MVDRRDPMLRIEHVPLVHARQPLGLVRLEEVAFERAREQVVVDAEEDVALRIAGGEQGFRHHRAGVSGLEDTKGEPALLLEGAFHVVGDVERVVRDEDDLARPVVAPAARDGDGDRHRRERGERLVTQCHEASPGRTARRTPRSSDTCAVSPASSFEIPRVDPGSSVSPSSGYTSPPVQTPEAGP